MQYKLLETITRNMRLKANPDGSINVQNVIAKIGIVGSPVGKFIQNDQVPEFNIPANETSANQPAYIEAQTQAYVTKTYPNT